MRRKYTKSSTILLGLEAERFVLTGSLADAEIEVDDLEVKDFDKGEDFTVDFGVTSFN